MDKLVINGGGRAEGEINIAGAKNACLALMPVTLLTEDPITLTNAPRLSDIKTMSTLLQSLGTEAAELNEGKTLIMSSPVISNIRAEYDIVRQMRASILVLGPILARNHEAEVSLPGGCAIGARPVDIHLQVIEALGATYELIDGYICAKAPKNGLIGGEYTFPFVSVGATETALLSAVLANGVSIFKNAAKEPEIVDLANLLNKMGAKIKGAGSDTITIQGVEGLHGTTHEVVMDRIELGSYMLVPAIAGGEVFFPNANPALIGVFIEKMEQAGVKILQEDQGIRVKHDGKKLSPVNITTEPFPGFPTDLQAQFMAALCLADGISVCNELIFENRFMHAPELVRMGANIDVDGGSARITGVDKLRGAPVMATDLRASFSLILAGIAAEGETVLSRLYHLDRGYEHVARKFRSIGFNVERLSE